MSERRKTNKKKRIILTVTILILFLLLLFLLLYLFILDRPGVTAENEPTLTVETPQKISASDGDVISLDVTVSALGEAVYPAASMSISFDPSRLEFLGVGEGNVFIRGDGDIPEKLPDWSCDPMQCNQSGMINIMYLDITGGKNAFSQELLEGEDNVLLRLNFRLRGSARKGDVYDLIVEDAVFAASDENESLAVTKDTLKVKNGKIVVGE